MTRTPSWSASTVAARSWEGAGRLPTTFADVSNLDIDADNFMRDATITGCRRNYR